MAVATTLRHGYAPYACTLPVCAAVQCINANRVKDGFLRLDRTEFEWLGVKWWVAMATGGGQVMGISNATCT